MTTTLTVRAGELTLSCGADGTGIRLGDEVRKVTWLLEETAQPLDATTDGSTITQRLRLDDRRIRRSWEIADGEFLVTTTCEPSDAPSEGLVLPGTFVAEGGGLQMAVPVMQGVLVRGGEAFVRRLRPGGHVGMSMGFLAFLGERGGLVVAPEDPTDWEAVVGLGEDGVPFGRFEALGRLGRFGDARRVRIRPSDASVTGVCKTYRGLVQDRGRFATWKDKLRAKPGLERLFGALMTFIGYNASDLDYAAECRKLKAFGFDRAFVYPVRFNTYSQDFKMGGDAPIDLDDGTLAAILDLGYDVAPWTWVVEALDDGSDFIRSGYRRRPDGESVSSWKIDEYQWYRCCTPFQTAFVRDAYKGRMETMTWAHYDVNASIDREECYAQDHPGHPGVPADRRDDLRFTGELLGAEVNGGRVVSSEGFQDSLSVSYDIGTTKLVPAWGSADVWTVPMTALVYHDSMVHDWWELHNYNAAGGFDSGHRFGRQVDGFPKLKAAMDALCGWPPNVFPFGRQYRWVDIETRQTEHYTVEFDDPRVQEALQCALPVTQLHRRVGKLEMLSHRFVTEDGAVQESVFEDGTRVVANFGGEAHVDEEIGEVGPEGWRAA